MNLGGIRISENPALTKTVTTKIIKPWWIKLADTVLRWNPCNNWNNPDFTVEQVPDDNVIVAGDRIFAHPEVAARLRKVYQEKMQGTFIYGGIA